MTRGSEARRAPAPDSRLVRHDEHTWHVREIDATQLPGAPRPSSLVFECEAAVRRVWVFPANWRQLDDASLWRLTEVSPVVVPTDVDWRVELPSIFMTSVVAEREAARAAVELSRIVRAENRRLREQRQLLLEACRTSRELLQTTVRRVVREMSDAGMSQPAALSQLIARIEAVAFVLHDGPGIERLREDVTRWCALEFEAA